MFYRRVTLLARAELCARQRLQDVAKDTEKAGGEHARANVHATGQRHSGRIAGGGRRAGARGAGWGRATRSLSCTTGATSGGGESRLRRAVTARAGAGALVVGDVQSATGVLDVRLAVALSDGVVGVRVNASGEVGLADELGQGVLVLGEIGGRAVFADTLVGDFCLAMG